MALLNFALQAEPHRVSAADEPRSQPPVAGADITGKMGALRCIVGRGSKCRQSLWDRNTYPARTL
uniref:Uncharacterized protein n=1 Tax=Hyaloperonospora arabidopsidis (strain Emoy2) TaxID=559515 RepID=M4BF75_HYAAE